MNENEKIRLFVMLNDIKKSLYMNEKNKLYKEWLNTDKKEKFRNFVIDKYKHKINFIDDICNG